MRSFLGAYKVLARVLPNCASFLTQLQQSTDGKASSDKIEWTDVLRSHFRQAQTHLLSSKTITLPTADDQIWIVTDGAVRNSGIGATMYISRNKKIHLSGFFSSKLNSRHMTWLPCEIEALAIASAIKHFSPYIIQSKHKSCVLTDSKPCVQAYEKLHKGEFSSSPRVYTFLSTASQYQCELMHLAGAKNAPSDFASRNAAPCMMPRCQVCSFVSDFQENVVISSVSTADVLTGKTRCPFVTNSTWKALQQECPDLRRTHAYLQQGTRPSKKMTKIKDVKRYLNISSLSRDGLIVVRQQLPFGPIADRIVIPRAIASGILTALHLKLGHPTTHQLKSVCNRYFYALDLDNLIKSITDQCHQCTALRKVPHVVLPQSTGTPPEIIGREFAVDVMRRKKQTIFVLRETISSFTKTCLIPNEQSSTLRDTLLQLILDMTPMQGPTAVVRCDPAPGFYSLKNDKTLLSNGIALEIGRTKNKNKNPVAEKSIQELEDELSRQDPSGLGVTPTQLCHATNRLNSRIRSCGLAAREIWTQRDQFNGEQLPINDRDIISSKYLSRVSNHPSSERSKCPPLRLAQRTKVKPGDLVYILSDRDKTRSRNRYLVSSVDGIWCYIRKFSGAQLRQAPYKVKVTECYKVPEHKFTNQRTAWDYDDDLPMMPQTTSPSNPTNDSTETDLPLESPEIAYTPDEVTPKKPEIHAAEEPIHSPTNPAPATNNALPPNSFLEPPSLKPTNCPDTANSETESSTLASPLQESTQVLTEPRESNRNSPPVRKSSRCRRKPTHLNDYILY